MPGSHQLRRFAGRALPADTLLAEIERADHNKQKRAALLSQRGS
jgi:hypothetical protein